jgi:hypothetical protein
MEASPFYRALMEVDFAGHTFARMPFGTSPADRQAMRRMVIEAMDRALMLAPDRPAEPAPAPTGGQDAG